MKRTLARMFSLIATVTLALSLTSCATAGQGDDDDGPGGSADARPPSADASTSPWADARPFADARPNNMPVDANQNGTPDSAITGGSDAPLGAFCNSNAECPVSGECCFSLGGPGFCVPGTEAGGLCIPD